jgi:hypothetical protein
MLDSCLERRTGVTESYAKVAHSTPHGHRATWSRNQHSGALLRAKKFKKTI